MCTVLHSGGLCEIKTCEMSPFPLKKRKNQCIFFSKRKVIKAYFSVSEVIKKFVAKLLTIFFCLLV